MIAPKEDEERPEVRRRRRLVARNVGFLRRVVGERPVPLGWWTAVRDLARRVTPGPDALTYPRGRCVRRGPDVADAEMRALLADDVLGEFGLDARSIDLLCRRFQTDRPTAVLQCGAGVSTLALALLARRRRDEGARCVVVALEEGRFVCDAVNARLDRARLAGAAHVVHAPLDAEGRFRFDRGAVARLAGAPFDWVVVEGPVAPVGRPVHALPDVAPLCAEGAAWFLDDAYRDERLEVLASWAASPAIEVRGVHPLVGKGLAAGRVRPSRATA